MDYISQFLNTKDPVDKLVKEAQGQIVKSAENAITGEISKQLQKIGLGEIANRDILTQAGEDILNAVGGEIFGAINKELNLSSKSEIENNRGVLLDEDEIRAENPFNMAAFSESQKQTTLIYPPDLTDFYIKMDFKNYKRPAPNVTADLPTVFTICLPLPRNLIDQHAIGYNESASGIWGMIFNQGQGLAGRGEWDWGTAVGLAGQKVLDSLGAENLKNLLSQDIAARLNPHMSVLFNSPSFRRHSMQWLLAPNNPTESETIRKITRAIKAASLPTYATANGKSNINVLQYPMIVQLTLMPWGDRGAVSSAGQKNPYDSNMFRFKHSVITNVGINYAPDDLSFFDSNDNPPAFIQLNLEFLEIEYFTAEDYGRTGSDIDAAAFGANIIDNIMGKSQEDIAQAIKDDDNLGLDPKAQAAGGNYDGFNTFNVNDEIVSVYSKDLIDVDGAVIGTENLYKTANGQWFTGTSDTRLDIIKDMDSVIFDDFDVPTSERNVLQSTATPQTFANGLVKTIASNGSGGFGIIGS